jgi:hypothetical protein
MDNRWYERGRRVKERKEKKVEDAKSGIADGAS